MLCQVEQLGMVRYSEALDIQQDRIRARKAGEIADTLLLLEHPHVYTLGRNAHRENLLFTPERLARIGAEVFETDRGGDVTYHGPGQLVGYPIFDLTQHRRDVRWFMHSLEEALIRVARDFGIEAARVPEARGIFVGNNKLAAMGVHVSRWVTSHGFAFNVNTDLRYFEWIVPCGLRDKGVTSLERLLGHSADMDQVVESAIVHLGEVFGFEMRRVASPVGMKPSASLYDETAKSPNH